MRTAAAAAGDAVVELLLCCQLPAAEQHPQ
jgi:hypothetical protein